jgi:5-methylcytosine-specific restriction endonuclease McrA
MEHICTQINSQVLVLNQNYQPINICTIRRAIKLMWKNKAEIIVPGAGLIYSSTTEFPTPSVVRLYNMIKQPIVKRRLSRQGLFHRDNFTCQYCGTETKDLTIDHIVPRSKGGKHEWNNVVSACMDCNHHKAEKSLDESNMKLLTYPSTPKPNPYYIFYHRKLEENWIPYIPWRT